MHTAIHYCRQNPGIAAFLAGLTFCVIILLFTVITYTKPDFALVLATPQDCLRTSDAASCRAVVENALKIHARFAPRFADPTLCELQFGQGECREVTWAGAAYFAPKIAVIVAARDSMSDPKSMVPLYVGPRAASGRDTQAGARVFYRGRAVGVLRSKRFAGADISMLVDLKGQALTNEWVRKKRQS